MGHRDHAVLGQKLLKDRRGVGRCTCKSHIMQWANSLRVFKKNSLKPNAASPSASCYTDTNGSLEHSPSRASMYYRGPTLQKTIPVWGVLPSHQYNKDNIITLLTSQSIVKINGLQSIMWLSPRQHVAKCINIHLQSLTYLTSQLGWKFFEV